ncbi:hypothetical protein [Emcibacter sp. SYSU 3D8]|uniref:hypothetical protein n=1 Tax=Emcibacter sp. SYSU 3D8 TaxID=3133969 RepID=UPI0031FEC11C
MLKWLMRRRIGALERDFGYDASYMRDILNADRAAFMAMSRTLAMAQYHKDIPAAAWHAAKITAVMQEDCGPCTQIAVTMAERDGVDPGVLRALLAGEESRMPEDVMLAWRYARGVIAHDAEAAALRGLILGRWGPRSLVSIAFAITGARLFPTLKYALGHGQACVRITVAGDAVPVARRAA